MGAALVVNAQLFQSEIQHDLTADVLIFGKKNKLKLMYGIDYRQYAIEPDGNYFQNPTNPGQTIYYQKIGSFTQATRVFFENKLKLNAVIRIDKNQFFNAKINARLAAVYSPKDTQQSEPHW